MGVPRSALKIFFVALGYLGCFGFVFWLVAPRWGFAPKVVGLMGHLWWLAFVGAFIAKLWWLYVAWTAIPESCRFSGRGHAVKPEDAAVKHLFPWSAVFWQFDAHVGVAEATNAVLASYDTKAEASARLPFVACCLFFVPGVNLLVFPGLLFLHMRDVDAAHEEMARCLSLGSHARPYVPPRPPTMLSMSKVIAFASLLTWIPLPWLFIELVHWTSAPAREARAKAENSPAPPPFEPDIERELDDVGAMLKACAESKHGVPDNLSECREADTRLRQLNAEKGKAIYVYATPKLTAWTPTYGHAYSRRIIKCAAGACSFERLAGE